MTSEQREKQLINRVYGNVSLENPKITHEFVIQVRALQLKERGIMINSEKGSVF